MMQLTLKGKVAEDFKSRMTNLDKVIMDKRDAFINQSKKAVVSTITDEGKIILTRTDED
jgi:lipoate-protein ligase A